MTARHVVRALVDTDTIEAAYIMLPRSAVPWSALDIHAVPLKVLATADTHSDVAVFVVNVNDNPATRGLEIKTFPVAVSGPVVGAELVGFGYPQQKGTLAFTMLASSGTVEEVYACRRDSAFVNWPSFRTDADFDFGTSGGPVVDDDGCVIGIVSTGSHGYSYAALAGGLLELVVDLHGADGEVVELSIKALLAMDVIASAGRAVLRRDADGVVVDWPCRPAGTARHGFEIT